MSIYLSIYLSIYPALYLHILDIYDHRGTAGAGSTAPCCESASNPDAAIARQPHRVCVSPVWVAPLVWVAPSVCQSPSVWAPSVWVGPLWVPPLLCLILDT